MAHREFTLTFKLPDASGIPEEIAERLGAAGCTDALLGFGQAGHVALHFTREAESFERAFKAALEDAEVGLRGAWFVSASRAGLGRDDKPAG